MEKGIAKSALAPLRGLGMIQKQTTECTDKEEGAARVELKRRSGNMIWKRRNGRLKSTISLNRLPTLIWKGRRIIGIKDEVGGMKNSSVAWSNKWEEG